jgi:predicted nucleic acid-binding protein
VNGSFLLDTNIVSELMRPRPAANVATWVGSQEIAALFLSVVTVGELEAGFETMLDAHRRAQLEALLERLISRLFAERVLPITQAIAARWGRLSGMRQTAGRPLGVPDGMIAATAFEHGLTVVTRNMKDFDGLGVTLFNPWEL